MKKTTIRSIIQKVFLFALLLGTVGLNACKDDVPELDAAAYLPDKRWVFTELKVTSPFTSNDFYADFEDCERDDFMVFKDGGILLMDEGPTKCDADDPQQTQGTWQVQGNTLSITGLDLGVPNTTVNLEIEESTETTLRGTFKERVQGITFTGKISLKAL